MAQGLTDLLMALRTSRIRPLHAPRASTTEGSEWAQARCALQAAEKRHASVRALEFPSTAKLSAVEGAPTMLASLSPSRLPSPLPLGPPSFLFGVPHGRETISAPPGCASAEEGPSPSGGSSSGSLRINLSRSEVAAASEKKKAGAVGSPLAKARARRR